VLFRSRQVSIAQIQLQLGEIRRGPSSGGEFKEAEEVKSNSKKTGEIAWDDSF
jgi:hypothetical protein